MIDVNAPTFSTLPVRLNRVGLAALKREVMRQAEMIAYSDSFLAAALISLAAFPLAFLFRESKAQTAAE